MSTAATPFDPKEFSNWCRALQKNRIAFDSMGYSSSVNGLEFIDIFEQSPDSLHSEKLEACLLPHSKIFPSMLDLDKQSTALAQNMVTKRIKEIDILRFNDTVDRLKNRESTAWIGHSGTSKSTEANFLLMEFLTHLGEEGWPRKLAHRIGRKIYEYEYNATDKKVECAIRPAVNQAAVEAYCAEQKELPKADQPLLFLDLDEKEVDPCVSGITVFIAVSSREVKVTLKTLHKTGTFATFLVRPHTAAEMRMMGRLIFRVDPAGMRSRLGLNTTHSEADVIAVINKRILEVGPLSREVFLGTTTYDVYVKDMKRGASHFLAKLPLEQLSYNKIPTDFKQYVAPHPVLDKQGKIDTGDAEFRLLSPLAADLIAAATTLPDQVQQLIKYGHASDLVEGVMQWALMQMPAGSALSPGANSDAWEWHRDPGFRKMLTNATLIKKSDDIPLHKRCDRLAEFSGMTFQGDARMLKPGALYKSTTHNFVLVEFFTFGTPAPAKPASAVTADIDTVVAASSSSLVAGAPTEHTSPSINGFQSTTENLPNHPFTVSSIKRTFEGFNLYDSESKHIRFNLICVVDSYKGSVKGCKFTATTKDLEGLNLNAKQLQSQEGNKDKLLEMDLKELWKVFPEFKQRLFTYIARADIYNIKRNF
jgi:hypothetical protein